MRASSVKKLHSLIIHRGGSGKCIISYIRTVYSSEPFQRRTEPNVLGNIHISGDAPPREGGSDQKCHHCVIRGWEWSDQSVTWHWEKNTPQRGTIPECGIYHSSIAAMKRHAVIHKPDRSICAALPIDHDDGRGARKDHQSCWARQNI